VGLLLRGERGRERREEAGMVENNYKGEEKGEGEGGEGGEGKRGRTRERGGRGGEEVCSKNFQLF